MNDAFICIYNYCPDGENGNFHCSSSFLKATLLICEAQLSFAAHQKYILWFFSLWWMIKGICTLFSLLFIFLWKRKPWLDNSIQDYLYGAFYDTIVAKQLYRKLHFCDRFIHFRNLIYLTYGKIRLILYTVWGLASSEDWLPLRSSEGLASSLLRGLVISDQ